MTYNKHMNKVNHYIPQINPIYILCLVKGDIQ